MRVIIFSLIFILSFCPSILQALPEGEDVVSGNADFQRPDDNTLNITTSHKVIINYNSFNIAQQEAVRFFQPSSASIALNRVIGVDPSSILGTLTANGRIFLINPNGIFFGQGCTIDTGSFIASTLDISNEDFLGGNYLFREVNPFSSIVNEGSILAQDGGFIGFISSQVINEGLIQANMGKIVIGSGSKVTIDLDGDDLVNFVVEEPAINALIKNKGEILADSGTIILDARDTGEIIREVINNEGRIEANRIVNEGGIIKLIANNRLRQEGQIIARDGEVFVDSEGATFRGSIECEEGTYNMNTQDTELSGDYDGTHKFYDEGDITVDGDLTVENGYLMILADHRSENLGSWHDGKGDLTLEEGNTIKTTDGRITLAGKDINLEGKVDSADSVTVINNSDVQGDININDISAVGDVTIESSGDVTVANISTYADVDITASNDIVDDKDSTTWISAENIILNAGGDIGGFDKDALSLDEQCLPMLDVALGNGVLVATASGDIYIAEHNASLLFTSKYFLTSTGDDNQIALANLTTPQELTQIILGVTLSVVPVGLERRDLILNLDMVGIDNIRLMAERGIRTVRTYYPPSEDLLDAFHQYGIQVIVGFPNYDDRNHANYYDNNQMPYTGAELIDISRGGYLDYIQRYKDHPAILMWELGNEYNMHPEWFGGDLNNWWDALKVAANEIRAVDTTHAISTVLGDTAHLEDDIARSEDGDVDIIGFNLFKWDDYTDVLADIKDMINVPFYLSEAGADSYNNTERSENQLDQLLANQTIWNSIKDDPDCLGITFMSWQDEWWKAGGSYSDQNTGGYYMGVPYDGYGNEEYWGWVEIDGTPKLVLSIIPQMWGKGDMMLEGNFPDPDNDVLLIAKGSIFDGYNDEFITGKEIQLYAAGDIGSNNYIGLDAEKITAEAGGVIYIEERNGAVFDDIDAGGVVSLLAHDSSVLNRISGPERIDIRTTDGDLTIEGQIVSDTGGINLILDNGSLFAQNAGPHIVAKDDTYIHAPWGKITPEDTPLNVSIEGGDLFLNIPNILGEPYLVYGNLTGSVLPEGQPILINTTPVNPPGNVYFNGILIWSPSFPPIVAEGGDFSNFINNLQATTFLDLIAPFMENSKSGPFIPAPTFFFYHPLGFSGLGEPVLDIGAYQFIEESMDE